MASTISRFTRPSSADRLGIVGLKSRARGDIQDILGRIILADAAGSVWFWISFSGVTGEPIEAVFGGINEVVAGEEGPGIGGVTFLDLRDVVAAMGPAAHVEVLPLGVDASAHAVTGDGPELTLACVGTAARHKGIFRVVEALRRA